MGSHCMNGVNQLSGSSTGSMYNSDQSEYFNYGQSLHLGNSYGAQPVMIYPVQGSKNDLSQIIINSYSELVIFQQSISELVYSQKDLITTSMNQFNCPQLQVIQHKHLELNNLLKEKLNSLLMLKRSYILDIEDLQILLYVLNEIEIHVKQLELLHNELEHTIKHNTPGIHCALVIIREPFPEVISKGQELGPEVLVVKLLFASVINLVSQYCPVNVELVRSTTRNDKKKYIDPLQIALDISTNEAKFPLKFLEGTRRVKVNLRFSMKIPLVDSNNQSVMCSVETPLSKPFIVITSDTQWLTSTEEMFKIDAFQSNLSVSWTNFCNTLNQHFIRVTKQDPPVFRGLAISDFLYMNHRFFDGKQSVDYPSFSRFFEWFGVIMNVLRHTKHMNKLWQYGLIYGFMNRNETEKCLYGKSPGTFVIRFSERHHGKVAIAYVSSSGRRILHYLVADNDTSKKRTLGNFICESDQLTNVLKLVNYHENNSPSFLPINKIEAFMPYCSDHNNEDTLGYDPMETPWTGLSFPLANQGDAKRRKRGIEQT
eukprot:TRINITY_DN7053_c0_g1_i1.p1 TRINITY_DN7053_c0_g1~~TRINITY_DN7053_c0_g1_i1.p1  ORF type:complete len:616 (+),score=85.33 TRINITY_DN7053_c0_g1_i1:226-1848(+)